MLGSPFSKEEIKDAFVREYEAVHAYFAGIDKASFFDAPPEVWSPADNLVHLLKSASPVIMALNLPKWLLRLRFGRAKRGSQPLAQVRADYMEVHRQGLAAASSAYEPQVEDKSTESRAEILSKWQTQVAKLTNAFTSWSEKDLDRLILPHPLLGKLTVREILFFTLYHNLHHVNDVQRLLGQSEGEWFD